jgi:hypothetical protein
MGWPGLRPGPFLLSTTLVVLRTLTNVGGTFSHHVLIVVDTRIGNSGLGLIRGDHEEFLPGKGREDGEVCEVQVRGHKSHGTEGWVCSWVPYLLPAPSTPSLTLCLCFSILSRALNRRYP